MKLEHLIQSYQFNRIPAKIKQTMKDKNEVAGVIEFNENIYASYLLDEEGFVIVLKLFINGIVDKNKKIANQIKHTTQSLIIIQKSIELLGNTKKEEANKILKSLGIFSGKIKEKAVKFFNYIYEIESPDGLLMFSILENENKRSANPPAKISSKKIS